MTPLDYLQQPQTLKLALGELSPAELRLAQMTVAMTLHQLARMFQQLPTARSRYDYDVNDDCNLSDYAMGHLDGWNDCIRQWRDAAAACRT